MLSSFRVLDLTNERGLLCGKALADLGADVILVEPPGGSPARRLQPFYQDQPDPERSLYWFSYCASKRSVTLNLETSDGRDLFKRLVQTADVVLDSQDNGYLAGLGLGYPELSQIVPGLVMTSITPYGLDGPYSGFAANDLCLWSMSGFAYLTGDSDRPPVQISFPQAYLNASLEGAVGTMIALYHREMTGQGQQVDVSIQASTTRNTMNASLFWETSGVNLGRSGPFRVGLSVSSGQRVLWRCKDGEVSFFMWGGKSGYRINQALVAYMDEEGMAPQFMKELDWENFDMSRASNELFQKFNEHIGRFFMSHTKEELFQQACQRGITLYPVQTVREVAEDTQLQVRDFWEPVDHPELGQEILYPHYPCLFSNYEPPPIRRAPLIGEHNQEIWRKEMSLSPEQLAAYQQSGVI
ncbi:MAG: CoA transferase [Desulfarculaceae bacterium]|jgi:benzylsuccinate CoA-transferase BbsE subunit/naphthyl-2-methylsuccinate CoA transferase subunit